MTVCHNLLRCALAALALFPGMGAAADAPEPGPAAPAKVVVIPVREQIAQPVHFVLRRGLKDAIAMGAQAVVLDMDTPGGRLDVTLEMIEALLKFPGRTFTFVNNEAISAGAFISAATQEIHFAPEGVIGAAAAITSSGQDLEKTASAKILSYMKAKVRSMSGDADFRAEAVSAMADLDYELKIGDRIISPKGELLTLTAKEAVELLGDPPRPLLGAGVHSSLEAMLDSIYGPGGYQITRLEATWSESFAQYITNISPILLAVGLLLLMAEFKTPGFGVMGIAGALLLGVVFFGHHAAGLSGHEPALFFAVGVLLILIELFFIPGVMVLALSGALLILGSLIWSMADVWPNEPLLSSGEIFIGPLVKVLIAVLFATAGFLALLKLLPGRGPWGRLVLASAVGGEPLAGMPIVTDGAAPSPAVSGRQALLGRQGVSVTPLFPSGQVEIDGRRYEARAAMQSIPADAPVTVTRITEFGLIVEEIEP